MSMNLGVCCDECNAFIKKGEIGYHRKHVEEIFCSKECLKTYVTDNLEIRPTKIEED